MLRVFALLRNHSSPPGLEKPNHGTSDTKNLVSIRPDKVEPIMKKTCLPENSPEGKALNKTFGFGFRVLLGEFAYAYVLCRLDIGYAVCFLSRYSIPLHMHYLALKHVCRYL